MPQSRKTGNVRPPRRSVSSRAVAPVGQRLRGISSLRFMTLALVTVGLYADALRNGFVTDDTLQVLDNRFIISYRYIPKLFATNVWAFRHSDISNYYRPLQMLFYMGEHHLFGFHSWIFHLANLLLNFAVVCAVYSLVRALAGETLAFWTALLFAVHPVHTEVVVWIAAVPELLCALSLFMAMFLYHRARNGIRPVQSHSLATAVFFAGLFCKETAMVFPVVLLAYEFFFRRDSVRSIFLGLRRLAPYACALCTYLIIRFRVLGAFAPGFLRQQLHSPFTSWQIFLSVPVLLREYIFKLLLPIDLNYFYQFIPQREPGWDFIFSAALVGALFVVMFWLRKSQALLAFALAWFFLTLAPALSISSVGENVFTERYLYIPSFGFCVFIAWGWLRIKETARTRAVLITAYSSITLLLIFYAVQVVRRIPDWRSDLSLMQKTITQSPGVPQIQSGLGVAYYQTGEFDLAISPLERSLALNPDSYLPHLYLALTLSALGDNQEASAHLARANELKPRFEPPWPLFGQVYVNLKQWNQAIECYRNALVIEPENPVLFTVLGEALQEIGETQESISAFREAIRIEPGALDASTNLAITLSQQGNTAEAVNLLASALRIHPSGPHVDAAWVNLGTMYAQMHDWDAAEAAYEHALELNSNLGIARQLLESVEKNRTRLK